MKNKFAFAIVMFSVVVLLSSCSKVPQVEIDAANAAIEDVRSTGADLYVPAEFNALQDSMNSVNELVEASKGKMFASFGEVKTKLARITELSATVKASAETRKAEVQAEVDAVMAEVSTLVVEANALVANAPKGKEGAAAVEAISAEITTVEAATAEATALVEQGKWLEALDKLNAAKGKISSVTAELQEVMEKFKGRR